MAANNTGTQKGKKDITLMTLLAYEATKESRQLLRKHNHPDAKSIQDLEAKLAELYFETKDKIALEKEFAEIHPHRKWLEKYIKPAPQPVVISAENIVKEEVSKPNTDVPVYSNADGGKPEKGILTAVDYLGITCVLGFVSIAIYLSKKNGG